MKQFLGCLMLLVLVACSKEETKEQRITGEALGTTYQIIYFGNQDEDVMHQAMDSIFDAVNSSMSTYQDNSLISKINTIDSLIIVDDMFAEVFRLSEEIHELSDGYFDPTVGNLVNAYGFGAERFSKPVDSTLIDSLKQYVGLDKVTLTNKNLILKSHPETYIEFNAIAKGYCLDRMATYFDSRGIENYLIELGGELVGKGSKPTTGKPWLAGIEDPNEDGTRSIAKTVRLKDRAMATSGNYRKFNIDDLTGKKYVHTINPKTGYPEYNDLLSASVFAKTCAEADAFATTFMAMGKDKSLQLLEKLDNVDVYFMYLDENGDIQTYASEGIKEQIQ